MSRRVILQKPSKTKVKKIDKAIADGFIVVKAATEEMKKRKAQMEKDISELNANYEKIKNEIITIGDKHLDLISKVNEKKAEVSRLNSIIEKLNLEINKPKDVKPVMLAENIEKLREEERGLIERIAELKGKAGKMISDVSAIESKVISANADMDKAKKLHDHYESKIASQKHKIEELDIEIKSRNENILKLDSLLSSMEENKLQAKEALKELDAREANKLEEIQKIKAKIDERRKELIEATKKLDKVQITMLGLLKREKRLNDLIPKIKEMFGKAGMEINFE